MSNLFNVHDLEGKIDWEGGFFSALEYGIDIDEYDVPESLKEEWDELAMLFGDCLQAISRVEEEIQLAKQPKEEE